ncbi:MAG: DUF2182 domain-containing protein [Methyloceanibacter sp.]
MLEATATERLVSRDRFVVGAALAAVVLVTAWYTIGFARWMAGMNMTVSMPWTVSNTFLLVVMWLAMMVAMMVPSAAPMVLLYARHVRRRSEAFGPYVPAAAFLAGYVVLWLGFAALAVGLQWLLDTAGVLSPMMVVTHPWAAAGTLAIAGAYQLTPAKDACLSRCRSPVHFLADHWRSGITGAFHMGLVHGVYCVGCCWALMLVLFVGGVMNLTVILALALFVITEKYLPFGRALSRIAGLGTIAASGAIITKAVLA